MAAWLKKILSAAFGFVLMALTLQTARAAEPTWEYAVQVSATAQTSPPQILLAWPQDTLGTPNSYTVYRKLVSATSWGTGTTLPGTATSYTDTGAAVGSSYEYRIVKAASTYTGYGYIYAGIQAPLVEDRGKVILVVDNTHAASLAAELTRLQQDLAGDGWTVLRHDVARNDSVVNVKNLIKADYNADPANVKAVFLFGRVPVPYSGLQNPDGHADHYGAWPADVFYGDMDGAWTDNSVNSTQTVNTDPADAARLSNVPGDGKYDQTTIPSAVELQVGRVDLANMPGRLVWGGPPSFPSEVELLRQYLNKDHNFRHKLLTAQRRGLVGDYFGVRGGEAFAASAYRNFAPFFGANSISNLNLIYNDTKGVWIPHLAANDYLWAYGCGAGSYSTIGGLGNTGLYNDGSTTEIVTNDTRAVFTLLFGSWLGDWDHEDNIMRSILATRTFGLACAWSGRPHWFAHHMGLGETIGYTARLTQNNTGLYQNQINNSAGGVPIALMGDPTLRMHAVAPPDSLTGATNLTSVTLTWTASPDSVPGYHVYRSANPLGPFTRLTGSFVTGTSFVDTSAPLGTNTYMVRAVKLEAAGSGTYTNASQGIFWTIGSAIIPTVDTTPPTISVTAPPNNATVSGSSVVVSADASDNVGVVGVQFKLDGANLGGEDLSAPFSVAWDTTSAANGPHTLTVVARDLAGNQTTASTLSVVVSNAAASTIVWFDDALPAGAGTAASGGDSWSWVSSAPVPFSGTLAHQSSLGAGLHEHYFNWATATLTLNPGETLFTYVYLDPANPPSELMLGWNADNWEHRAYWGANTIAYGTDGTASRRYLGPMPPAGQWVRLEVPASQVGLEGQTLIGMSFVLYNGRATWDYTGKSSQTNPPPGLPAVTVTAGDPNAAESGSDSGVFTVVRTGSTSAPLTVNFTLGGTAINGTDYASLGNSVTIPAGAASATVSVTPTEDTLVEGSETAVLTLATNAAYTVAASASATVTITDNDVAPPITNTVPPVSIVDYTTLAMPQPGNSTLHILSPTQLEVRLINSKQPDPARVTTWDLVDATGNFLAPALTDLTVTANGQPVVVQAVGFKRRPFYAPLAVRDLRLDNALILQLATPVAEGQTVEVKNPSGALWPATAQLITAADPLRYSPAIHVNQEGYVPSFPKQAMVGYYLGNLGEMDIPASLGFKLVDAAVGAVVFQGSLTNRADVGYTYMPAPYQRVLVADFSSFTTPGEYRLVVPGLGASLPFLIDDGIAMAFTRTYALGLYHQRCGTNNALPFTRFTHDVCHFALADVPSPQSSFAFTWNTVSNYAMTLNSDNPPQIAPALTGEAAQLYPLVNQGQRDVQGGHHDAGDYSKYTLNSAGLVHSLMFAVDAFPGVAALDNLGIPESGDGISDLMQEAKWEADYLAKIQDADGGFYFLVYPRDREYENNVLPDRGDPQVVWPKTTSATAAAVAALAQCASSPRFKQQFPNEAALYLQKAQLGWQFLTNAVARFGKDGAYQKITHYGDVFAHDDELAWAACELYLATGNAAYQQKLFEWYPNPNDPATYRWGWWRLWESYGCAVRSYAFAARTGRLASNQLDPVYLSRCENEVKAAGQDALLRAQSSAYGMSFPLETKRVRGGGWYFSSEQAFDITAAYQLDPRPEFLEAILSNLNYEGGANPMNVSYLTGLGWKRQREIVHQYAQNDRRVLPPDGIPLGNVQSYFSYLDNYGSELNALCFPQNDATTAPYAYYDRWGDIYNVTTEFVALFQARSLASVAFVATLTPARTQAWTSATAQIAVSAESGINLPVTATLQVPGVDLSRARIVWEAAGQQPAYADTFTFTPTNYGAKWVEAEIQLADGRRIFAWTNLFTTNDLPTVSISSADATATEGGTDTASFTLTRAGSTASDLTVTLAPTGTAAKWSDYRRPQGDMPDSFIIPAGSSSLTVTVIAWDDAEVEGTETATLTIQPNAAYNVGTPYNVTLTLLDNDGVATPPTVTVLATDANASRVGPDPAVFTISRTGSTNAALTVNYTLGGVAVNGVDYNSLGTTLTIPAGAASVTLTVMPRPATNLVGSETVVLMLSANADYAVGSPAGATVTIASNCVPTSSINFRANGATITWTSTPGRIYRVAYKDRLTDTNWTDLSGNITATGETSSWSDATAGASPQRFYMVYVTN